MKKREIIWINIKLKNEEARVFESLKEKLGTRFDTETVRVAFKRLNDSLPTS